MVYVYGLLIVRLELEEVQMRHHVVNCTCNRIDCLHKITVVDIRDEINRVHVGFGVIDSLLNFIILPLPVNGVLPIFVLNGED